MLSKFFDPTHVQCQDLSCHLYKGLKLATMVSSAVIDVNSMLGLRLWKDKSWFYASYKDTFVR